MRYTQVLKKVNKSKRLLRVFISNVHSGQAAGADGEASEEASWTLKIEGKLQEDAGGARNDNCMQAYTSEQKCLRPHKDYKRQIPKLWLWFELLPS